jgi:hypothetical protein
MHPELAPAPPAMLRRGRRIEAIAVREHQIARLVAEQRREIAALCREDREGMSERFVADELALAWHRSPRQARGRVDDALAFTAFPAVGALVGDGTWLMDHADAVLGELGACGLDEAAQLQVLALVLSRRPGGTPYQLRLAVRTAIVVLFPEHAAERARKAAADRDVTTCGDGLGGAQLTAFGPATDVAAMMASIDALSWPPAPGDTRSAAERRFDTLRDLVCGTAQPGQWHALVLVGLGTLDGQDELPGEIVGAGPVPAHLARAAAAAGELRRVVVDEHGQLVAVDPEVHRPDLPVPARQPFPVAVDDEPGPAVEPDPDAPSAEDLRWLEEHTDRQAVYRQQDAARARRRRAARHEPSPGPLADFAGVSALELHALDLVPADDNPVVGGLPAPCWSATAFTQALQRMRTAPLRTVDLSTDRYAVPARLKRHLVLRDRTCVFPGCPRPAEQCDKDHVTPWPAGPTAEPNLDDACEHHHQAKHDRFRLQRLPDGTFRWTTPAGHTYDRPPRPVLDLLQERPPPQDAPG